MNSYKIFYDQQLTLSLSNQFKNMVTDLAISANCICRWFRHWALLPRQRAFILKKVSVSMLCSKAFTFYSIFFQSGDKNDEKRDKISRSKWLLKGTISDFVKQTSLISSTQKSFLGFCRSWAIKTKGI